MKCTYFAATIAVWIGGAGFAQPGTNPAASGEKLATDAAAASPADHPATIVEAPPHPDAEIESVLKMLTGSLRHAGSGDTDPPLWWNAARVAVEGLDNAVYVEVSREDSPANPFRQSIAHVYRRKEGLALRFFEFAGNPGLKDAAVGLWAAPDVFVKLSLDTVRPNADLLLEKQADGSLKGRTLNAALTTTNSALEVQSDLVLSPGAIKVADRGIDATGKVVWGHESADALSFVRSETPTADRVKRLPGGLVVVELVPAPAGAAAHVSGGEVGLYHSGWLQDGSVFDPRRPGAAPMRVRLPGTMIQGWNDGLADIALGAHRRMVIPPGLGYGDKGAGRGAIPPNSTLIFDVECVWIDNTQPPPPPAPPGSTPAAPAPTTPPPPAPAPTPTEQPK